MQPWTEARVRNERASGFARRSRLSGSDHLLRSPIGDCRRCCFPSAAFALANPISAELAVMRVSLWPGLFQALGSNQRRQQTRARLFEVGRRYAARWRETEVIAGVARARRCRSSGAPKRRSRLLRRESGCRSAARAHRRAAQFRFVPETHPALHPGQSARIWRGICRGMDRRAASGAFAAAGFDISGVRVRGGNAVGLGHDVPVFVEISRYPAIRRDIAAIVEEALAVETLLPTVRASAGAFCRT